MSEILLALESDDFVTYRKLDRSLVEQLYGVKILLNEMYKIRNEDERTIANFAATAMIAREQGARRVVVDSKLGNDTKQEMTKTVSSIVAHMKPKERRLHASYPKMLTVNGQIGVEGLSAFEQSTTSFGIEPVCFLTSSRMPEKEYRRYRMTPEEFAREQASFLLAETTMRTVICAAPDAETIADVSDEFELWVTGAYVFPDEQYMHARTASVDAVRDIATVCIFGSAILKTPDPRDELLCRLERLAKD